MRIGLDLYVRRQSWLHRTDPRVKLLFVTASLALLLAYRNIFFMIGALLCLHLLHLSARVPAERLALIWKRLLPITVFITALWTLFNPKGPAILSIWVIRITPLSVVQGLVIALRIIAMAFVVFAWLYTTDHPAVVRSLVKWKVPYEWGLTLSLALRYIPTLQNTYTAIADAQQARGLRIDQGSGFRRLRAQMPIFVAMVISAMRTSEQLSRALESRAFGASGVQRTCLRDIRFRTTDYVYTFLILIITCGLLYLNLRFRFGDETIRFLV